MDFEGKSYIDTIPRKVKRKRLIWGIIWLLFFRPTPRWTFNSWRIFLLKLFGAKIGKGCRVLPTCRVWAPWNLEMGCYSALADNVDCYSMDRIIIGDRVTVSQRAFLCAGSHDISSLRLPLVTKPIYIGNHAWLCAECFVGPGCRVGEGAVIAARSVLVRNADAWKVYAGNPARPIKERIIS